MNLKFLLPLFPGFRVINRYSGSKLTPDVTLLLFFSLSTTSCEGMILNIISLSPVFWANTSVEYSFPNSKNSGKGETL